MSDQIRPLNEAVNVQYIVMERIGSLSFQVPDSNASFTYSTLEAAEKAARALSTSYLGKTYTVFELVSEQTYRQIPVVRHARKLGEVARS